MGVGNKGYRVGAAMLPQKRMPGAMTAERGAS
jgi:hypothetical protein